MLYRLLPRQIPSVRLCGALVLCSVAVGVLSSLGSSPAQERRLDDTSFQSILGSSPFTRSLNLTGSLVMTGVAYIDGEPIATFVDRDTRATHVLTSKAREAGGPRLVSLDRGAGIDKVSAEVFMGGQTFVVRYDSDAASELARTRPKPNAGSPPGNPGKPGGAPQGGFMGGGSEASQKYAKLDGDGKRKFFEVIKKNPEKMRAMSPEDRARFVNSTLDTIIKKRSR